jgi:hypothetical protein
LHANEARNVVPRLPGMRRKLARLRRLSWHRQRLLAESTLFLAAAAGAIALLPFARLVRLIGRRSPDQAPPPDSRQIAGVRWAVETAARYVPFHAKCFERGLAAHWMLRRRGISATLFYGAALETRALTAHVWVRAGTMDVVGCENAADYTAVAQFPADTGHDLEPQRSLPPSIR